MKLYTEISDCGKGDVMVVYNGDCGLSPDEQAERDLLAAHALLQAMVDCRKRYSSLEYAADQTAEHYLQSTLERAAEILAGWLGEERG